MATWSQEDVQKAVQAVGEKAAIDQEFRKLVLKDPHEAIKQVVGKEVPEGVKLKMVEPEPDADLTIVVPSLQTDELSDTELDQVAGGKGDCSSLQTCGSYCNPNTSV